MKLNTLREYALWLLMILVVAVLMYLGVVYITGEGMGNVGSFMSGVFGSAVALAGAFVAIKLATHALELQKEQKYREDVQSHFEMVNIISHNLEGATHCIMDVVSGTEIIHVAAQTVDKLILQFTQKYVPSNSFADFPAALDNMNSEMQLEIEEIKRLGTTRMHGALSNIATKCRDNPSINNPISAFLLSQISGEKVDIGIGPEVKVAMSDMQFWAGLFQAAADGVDRINRMDYRNYILAVVAERTVTYQYIVDKNGERFDHASLRAFLLVGRLSGLPRFERAVVEFIEHLPQTEKIVAAVKRLLPAQMQLSDGLVDVLNNFNLTNTRSGTLTDLLEAYRLHQPRLDSRLAGMA
jgi:hypothetical protein